MHKELKHDQKTLNKFLNELQYFFNHEHPDANVLISNVKEALEQGVITKEEFESYMRKYRALQEARYKELFEKISSAPIGVNTISSYLFTINYNFRKGKITDEQAYNLSVRCLLDLYSVAKEETNTKKKIKKLYKVYLEARKVFRKDPLPKNKREDSLLFYAVLGNELLGFGRDALEDAGIDFEEQMEIARSSETLFIATLRKYPNGKNIRLDLLKITETDTQLLPGFEYTVLPKDLELLRRRQWAIAFQYTKSSFISGDFEKSDYFAMFMIDISAKLKDTTLINESFAWVHKHNFDVLNKILSLYTSADKSDPNFRSALDEINIVRKALERCIDYDLSLGAILLPSAGLNTPQSELESLIIRTLDHYIEDAKTDEAKKNLEHLKNSMRDYIRASTKKISRKYNLK